MVARRNPTVPRRTVLVAGCPVQTTVTARPAIARRWLYTTLWRSRRQLHSGGGLTVGLGVQWTPPFRKLPSGAEPRPATLQLCVGNRCLVFQLARAGGAGVPHILRRFLSDGRVTFAAYNVESDRRKLRAHHGLEVASALELRSAGGGLGSASMATMADRLLGIRHGVDKSRKVGVSRWHVSTLSKKQVRYAAVDAYISCRLGVCLRRRRAAMASESESEAEYSDNDDVQSTASSDEYEYDYGIASWDRDRDDRRSEAEVDDHLYDSISMCSY